MKAQNIQALVAIITAALIGLIFIQIYWINNALTLRQEELDRSVSEAISEVVDRLEKHETLTKIKSHKEAKYLFINPTDDEQTLPLPPDDSLLQYVITRSIENSGNDITLEVTEELNGKKTSRTVTHQVDELSYSDELEEEMRMKIDVKDSTKGAAVNMEANPALVLDNLKKKLSYQKAFIGDIVNSLIEVNLNETIEDRIDARALDSLLKKSMSERGIHTPFEYAVFDHMSRFVMGSNDDISASGYEYSAQLFPNDIVQAPAFLKITLPRSGSYLMKSMWVMLFVSLAFMLAIIATFFQTVSTIIRQKKDSAIKNDFINNMTHELKTPISTISLACEALKDPGLSKMETVKSRYVNMIGEENKRLGLLVEEVLQSAVLDTGDFKLKLETMDLHQLIKEAVEKFQIQVKERNGQLNLDLQATEHMVMADRTHFTNVVYNLLDNANKYSRESPVITVCTRNVGDKVELAVSDRGIGISAENLKKVFDRLYRVPTGNLHNVKGFGLGLSYVRVISERHGGKVTAKSQPGKGSTFIIELPFTQQTA